MLLIFRPAQAGGQFQVLQNVVIALAERGIGIEDVRILAEKIVVTVAVQARNRIGVHIGAGVDFRLATAQRWVLIFESAVAGQAFVIVGYARCPEGPAGPASTFGKAEGRQRVDEDVVVLHRFVMHIIAAEAEVESAGQV